MAKRQFNREERALTERNLKKIEEDLDDVQFLIDKADFTINRSLPKNYKFQMKQQKIALKEAENQKEQLQKIIEITKDQLKNGVEVKKNGGNDKQTSDE